MMYAKKNSKNNNTIIDGIKQIWQSAKQVLQMQNKSATIYVPPRQLSPLLQKKNLLKFYLPSTELESMTRKYANEFINCTSTGKDPIQTSTYISVYMKLTLDASQDSEIGWRLVHFCKLLVSSLTSVAVALFLRPFDEKPLSSSLHLKLAVDLYRSSISACGIKEIDKKMNMYKTKTSGNDPGC